MYVLQTAMQTWLRIDILDTLFVNVSDKVTNVVKLWHMSVKLCVMVQLDMEQSGLVFSFIL